MLIIPEMIGYLVLMPKLLCSLHRLSGQMMLQEPLMIYQEEVKMP